MAIRKFMSYSRYILVIATLLYLVLVWLYFKDNPLQLNPSSLLIWFLIIPALLIVSLLLIRWWLKKDSNKNIDKQTSRTTEETATVPESYKIFIYSSFCLPEGDEWSEVIDSTEDLTVVDDELRDFNGLPVLTKPITRVITQSWLMDAENYNKANNATENDESDEDDEEAQLDTITLRLGALIKEQLQLSETMLSNLAEHYDNLANNDSTEINAALDIHPEWQQQYIVSSDDNTDSNDKQQSQEANDAQLTASIELSIHLCLPENTNAPLLTQMLEQQLQSYGIPMASMKINTIIIEDLGTSAAESVTTDTEAYLPIAFIDEHIIPLAQADTAEICLLIMVDSQINESWVETNDYDSSSSELVPTEASALLIFCNQLAQDSLGNNAPNLDEPLSFSITKTSPVSANDRRFYLKAVQEINELLFNKDYLNYLGKAPLNAEAETKSKSKTPANTSKSPSVSELDLSDKNIAFFSDINLLNSVYDLAILTKLIEAMQDKGALVNEHYLGHYVPNKVWFTTFLSLAILSSASHNNKQQSDIMMLITKHNLCCVLWTVDFY